jgi:hypothetical protein
MDADAEPKNRFQLSATRQQPENSKVPRFRLAAERLVSAKALRSYERSNRTTRTTSRGRASISGSARAPRRRNRERISVGGGPVRERRVRRNRWVWCCAPATIVGSPESNPGSTGCLIPISSTPSAHTGTKRSHRHSKA